MRALVVITAEIFKDATGREPRQDDLERCNCPHVGGKHWWDHTFCGWNYHRNLPMFESNKEWPEGQETFKFKLGDLTVRDIESVTGKMIPFAISGQIVKRENSGKWLTYLNDVDGFRYDFATEEEAESCGAFHIRGSR